MQADYHAGGTQAPPPNANGWNNTDVTVSFGCADNALGSGIGAGGNTVAGATLTGNGANRSVTNTGACVDMAGNAAASSTVGGISIDKVKPVLAPVVSPNPVALNGVAVASADATDALSGVDTFGCAAVDTSTLGPGTVSCAATDGAGNTQLATASYLVTVVASKQAVQKLRQLLRDKKRHRRCQPAELDHDACDDRSSPTGPPSLG